MRKRSKPSLKLSLLSYAIAAAASGSLAQSAMAVDLCAADATISISSLSSDDTCTVNKAGAQFTVTAAGGLDGGATVAVSDATVSNAGVISRTDSASHVGALNDDISAIANSARALYFSASTAGAVTNRGTIESTATASGEGTGTGVTADVYATAMGISYYGDATALITNTGTISATASAEYTLTGTGTADVRAHATAINVASDLAGGLVNKGEILADATSATDSGSTVAVAIRAGGISGDLINNQLIRATASVAEDWGTAYGIRASGSISGDITNAGTIEASVVSTGSGGSAYGIYTTGSMAGLTNTGRISTAVDAGDDWGSAHTVYSLLGISGDIVNKGTIEASVTSMNSGGSAYGIEVRNGSIEGLTNSGVISASVDAGDNWGSANGLYISGNINGDILNTGTISAAVTSTDSGGSAYAIETNGTLVGNLTNAGKILASVEAADYWGSAYGVYASGGISGDITNSGTISAMVTTTSATGGSAYGIVAWGSGFQGDITNTGLISASVDGHTWVSAYGIRGSSVAGVITNKGTIQAMAVSHDSGGSAHGIYVSSLTETGAIKNSGTIIASAEGVEDSDVSAYGIRLSGQLNGDIVNSGLIKATAVNDLSYALAYGVYVSSSVGSTGSLANTGTIRATATSVSNSASAYGIQVSSLDGEAMLANSGRIVATAASTGDGANTTNTDLSAYAWGIYAGNVNDTASISNSGSITVEARANVSFVSAYGIQAGSVNDTGTITNSGTIVVKSSSLDSSASAYGFRFYGVESGAKVINSGRIAVEAIGNQTSNGWGGAYGMKSTNDFEMNGTFKNSGRITAYAEGNRASAYGMSTSGASTGATIANSGTIMAQAKGYDASYASAYGIEVASSLTGASVSNSGRIVVQADAMGSEWAGAYGIYVNGSVSGASEISNSGSISATVSSGEESASAYGIYNSSLSGSSKLTNSGSIVVRAAAASSYAQAYGLLSQDLNGTASITNSGTILVQADMSGTGSSDTATAVGIYAGNMDVGTRVTNSGTIVAQGSGLYDWIYGIQANGSGAVFNSGTIIGGVYLDSSVSLTNSGSIVTNATNSSYVGGNYTQEADGSLTLTLRDTNNYGSMSVNGTADFTASNAVKIALDPQAMLNDGDAFVDVFYASTLTAPDDLAVSDLSAFWNFEVTPDANGFDVVALQLDTGAVLTGAGVVLTPSQLALVDDALAGTMGADYEPLRGALNTAADGAAAAAVLEQMGPALSGAAAQATRIVSAGATNALSARMGETRGASSGDEVAQSGVWIKPFISQAEQDAVNGVSGFDADTTGFVIGLDGAVSDSLRLGVAVASAQSEVDSASASVDIRTTQFTLYGSYDAGSNVVLDADLSLGANGFNSSRNVTFANSVAEGNFNGNQVALGLALGKAFTMSAASTLTPSLSLRYSQVDLDGYTETGAGAFDLTVADTSEDTLLAIAKADYALTLGNKGVFMASLGVGMDTADMASATAQLGGNGPTFVSNGVEPESTLVTGGLGYRYVTAKNLEINAAWDVESRSDFVANTVSVKFKMPL